MAKNFLVEFIDGCDKQIESQRINADRSELVLLLERHKQQSISVLTELFDSEYFEKPINESATEVWLKYHMYQAKNSLGSTMLVFEMCHLIHGMIENYGISKIRNYLFSNGVFNERQLRAHLLEFFTTLMFKQDGWDATHNELYSPDTALDVVVEFEGEKRLIECKSIQEPLILDLLLTVAEKMLHLLNVCSQNRGKSIRLVQKIPFTYYLVGSTEKDFKRNIEHLFLEVRKYILSETQPKSPSIAGTTSEVHVEKHQEGIFDNYMAAFESYKFVLIGKVGSSYTQTLPHIPIHQEGKISNIKERIEKIKSAIRDKRKQHKQKDFRSRLYVLEIESFAGPSLGFEIDKVNENDLIEELRIGETVWLIHKDSRGNQIPKRTIKMLTRDKDINWVEELNELIENKQKYSVMRILSERLNQ